MVNTENNTINSRFSPIISLFIQGVSINLKLELEALYLRLI